MEGEGVAVSVADFGTHFKVLINQISAFTPEQAAPNLPVARVMWRPAPNFKTGVHQWIENGGGHHTVASLALTVDQILDWTSMLDVETVIID